MVGRQAWDVLVVGGGINGVGAALDAVSRGLTVLLVERDDLAVGTSSRSSKLIHGGLRYLEQFRFGLVREALAERRLLGSIAPHIVGMERFLLPVVGRAWRVPYIAAGLTLYDLLGGRHGGRFEIIDREEARRMVPALRSEQLSGTFAYSDGVFDDARLVVALARTARSLGASILTRVEMTGTETTRTGGIFVTLHDVVTGETREVVGRTMIDATGAFSAEREPGVAPSRGVHIVVPRDRIPCVGGMTVSVPGRVVFLIPWLDQWLIGTTDVPHTGPIDRPHATTDELAYLFDSMRSVMDIGIDERDVVAAFAGIRPLADDGKDTDDTASLSREERISEPTPGLFTIRGGKYTTYRRVAARVVDRVMTRLGRSAKSVTSTLPVVGAAPPAALGVTHDTLVDDGWPPEIVGRLVMRHGTEAIEVAATAREIGLDGLLVPGLPYLAVEPWWGLHREMALGIDDVLARRTRVTLEDRGHGDHAVDSVAAILGSALGWSAERRVFEAAAYRQSSALEYGVPTAPEPDPMAG
jgi:glycerol-3-phosphate dehydrogenase